MSRSRKLIAPLVLGSTLAAGSAAVFAASSAESNASGPAISGYQLPVPELQAIVDAPARRNFASGHSASRPC